MTSERPSKTAVARNERLAQALRANLKRRKQQSRGRAEAEKASENAGRTPRENKE